MRDYSFPWTNNWNNDRMRADAKVHPVRRGTTQAATVNLFVAHNRIHDFSYFLGFTEQNWNAQDYNFGLTPRVPGKRPDDRRRSVGRADAHA